jgi:hypothetical protein
MNWTMIGGIVAALGFLAGATGAFFRWVLPVLRGAARFADRVTGTPANPLTGDAAKPGLFEILDGQNVVLADLNEKVGRVTKQVENSHMSNLRDDLDDNTAKVDATLIELDRLHTKLDAHLKVCQPPTVTVNPSVTITTTPEGTEK